MKLKCQIATIGGKNCLVCPHQSINGEINSLAIFAGGQIRCDWRIKSPGVLPGLTECQSTGADKNSVLTLNFLHRYMMNLIISSQDLRCAVCTEECHMARKVHVENGNKSNMFANNNFVML